jgi:DegV family protein with EDD domain
MSRVAIVTDSIANLPAHLAQQLGIHVVPLLIHFQDQSYRDGLDVTPSEVYRLLRANKQIPTTSAPSLGDFLRVYEAAAQEASSIVSIHPSAQLTATHQIAMTASHVITDIPIRVIDSRTGGMAHGFAVLEAARAAASSATPDEIVARAMQVAARAQLLFTIDTLEYLRRGGRIGGAAALLGNALQIRPVLHITDGHVDALAQVRTKARAVDRIVEHMARSADGRSLHVAVFHADVPQEAEALQQRMAEQFECVELYVTEFTPVMGAHTGPGVLGAAFYVE